MKLWTGRFQKKADQTVEILGSSISLDSLMIEEDIAGSMAHASMLGETGIIEKTEAAAIVKGLTAILNDLKSGDLLIDRSVEDVHTFVEAELTRRIGDAGKRLHTARSRNDQVALDLRLYLKKECAAVTEGLFTLIDTLCQKASLHTATVMPGYTHLQRAQPITFGHHLMAYTQMFLRDIGRIRDSAARMDEMPLGSGALAATTYPINRESVKEALGFRKVTSNSLDGVADRDFCVELLSALSLVMVHLSRLSEEIILWSSWEFRFIELDDAFSTGSSIMPQKKNPDVAELTRGKTGRVIGDLTALLVMMKGLPLAYNRDLQEDKEAVFDAFGTVKTCLAAFAPMLKTMKVKEQTMREAASSGFINATDCADYLVKKGLPFRDAYKATGELVALCIEKNTTLEELPLEEYKKICDTFDGDIYEAISLDTCVKDRNVTGGPAPESVKAQIKEVQKQCEEMKK